MKPKVSVCMITYNQEEYITEAIESVLAQQTNFDFKLIIGDDCSIDNTINILKEYQKKYPEKIRLLLSRKNVGMMKNFVRTFSACTGEYMAILEGDDYWTSPRKLQKQVELLDLNPSYSMCFHATKAFYETNKKKFYLIPSKKMIKTKYFLEDILKYNFIATCSVMYRKHLVKKLPLWFNSIGLGDWPLHILYALNGSIGYIDEIMANYRIHVTSNFSSRSKIDNFNDIIKMQKHIDHYLKYKYHNIINKVIQENIYLLQKEYINYEHSSHC